MYVGLAILIDVDFKLEPGQELGTFNISGFEF